MRNEELGIGNWELGIGFFRNETWMDRMHRILVGRSFGLARFNHYRACKGDMITRKQRHKRRKGTRGAKGHKEVNHRVHRGHRGERIRN